MEGLPVAGHKLSGHDDDDDVTGEATDGFETPVSS